tara:strand:- start:1426 stop:1995 length:570 start_codon:yes stop_codon:yes gene_type:complete
MLRWQREERKYIKHKEGEVYILIFSYHSIYTCTWCANFMATKQETNKEEKEMSEYKYARTNSKGEVILRRDTEETLSFVTSILDKNNIPYEYMEGATMFIMYNKANVRYVYYWTTGRWAVKKRRIDKHYQSKGIEDFINRFFNKFADEQIEQNKVWAEEREAKRKAYFQKKMENSSAKGLKHETKSDSR